MNAGRVPPGKAWRNGGYSLRYGTRAGRLAAATKKSHGGHAVQDTESKANDASNNQILFPMAVGALFLAVLVAGALLG